MPRFGQKVACLDNEASFSGNLQSSHESMDFTEQILSKLGYTLTPMQEAASEVVGSRHNAVLLSPTGSGKTLAYLLPICRNLNAEVQHLQAVVIVPSRELAQQCDDVFRSLKTPLRSVCLHGGRPAMNEHRTLKEVKPHIVFATPGRLLDHLTKENILGGTVRVLVVDEFDKCLELGFLEEMENVVRRMPRVEQCVLTSATDAEEIPAFVSVFEQGKAGSAIRLDFLENAAELSRRQDFRIVPSPRKDKLETLAHLLSSLKDGLAMVFVLHRESADRVGKYLSGEGFSVETYHGGMEQEYRERALSKFRSGCSNILVATDLAARGLDIPEVRAVVHYHPAADADAFVHRNGRTARWDAGGSIYLIMNEAEALPDYVPADAEVCDVEQVAIRPMKPRWAAVYVGRGKKDKLSRMDIVGFFCKKGGLRAEEIGRIELGAHYACVAVLRSKMTAVLKAVAGEKIKGMKTLIEPMRR